MRLLGIDYGLRRTGIALAEMETGSGGAGGGGAMALPFEMFENLPDAQLAQAIGQLVRKEQIDTIVVGLPLLPGGGVSQQSKLTERFILTLIQAIGPGVPIHRTSEYLTSHDSEGKLAGHFTRNQKRQRVDAIAAARILQDWMDQQRK